VRFKHPELEAEFNVAHPRVQALALYLDRHARLSYGKDLMVTDVGRTIEEYRAIYGEEYEGPMPHLSEPWRGVKSRAIDFRTIGELTDDAVMEMVAHANQAWPRGDGKPTALWHSVKGSAQHLHVQVQA